jgi:hypothetical protein
MKNIAFRLTAIMALVMISMTAQAETQDWGGRVIDEKGEPMPFVNVVLLSLPDSAFVHSGIPTSAFNAISTCVVWVRSPSTCVATTYLIATRPRLFCMVHAS